LEKSNKEVKMKTTFLSVLALILSFCNYQLTLAHCDTMDGPVIADARKAIEQNNVNYILKWVPVENENQIKAVFGLTMKIRAKDPGSKESADRNLFETLVRIHRIGEGKLISHRTAVEYRIRYI
jgi:hypothetical protein